MASIATRIYDWFHYMDTKLWVQLESALYKTPLSALSWIPHSSLSKKRLAAMPLIAHATVNACKMYVPPTKLFSPDGPLTPMFGNPELSIPALVPMNVSAPRGKPPVLYHLLTASSLKTYE